MNTIDKACSSLNTVATPNRKPSELNHYFFRNLPSATCKRDCRLRCCRKPRAAGMEITNIPTNREI